jgi:hypothetical protein
MAAQFDFIAGLDISSLTSVTQAQLMQMINQIAPLSNIGGVIFQAGTSLNTTIAQGTGGSPDVTNNPRFVRYIWLNTYSAASAPPTAYYYDASTGDWTSTSVAAGSITNASINAAAAIAVSKLATGTARYLVRTNAAGTSVEYVAPASIFSAGEMPIAGLVPNGSNGYLKTSSGVATWVDDATERALIQSAITGLSVSQLTAGSNGAILYVAAGTPTWGAPATALAAGSNIPLGALAQGGATTRQLLQYDGSSWAPVTPSLQINATTAISASGTVSPTGNISNAVHTIPHSLGAIPKMVRVVLKCLSTEGGWAVNDEVDIANSYYDTGASIVPNITVGSDATNITVLINQTATKKLRNKTTAAVFTPTDANWQPKAYAWA